MPTLHLPLLIVLLLIPNTSWRDWHRAGDHASATALQRQIAALIADPRGRSAIAVMNARTADKDRITPLAGGRSLLAGARLRSDPDEAAAAERLGYAATAENLPKSLAAAGIVTQTEDDASAEIARPSAEPAGLRPRGEFIIGTVIANDPRSAAAIGAWRQRVAAAGARGILILASPNPTLTEYREQDQLTPVVVWQPCPLPSVSPRDASGPSPALLYSPSTRTAGLIANTDIAATVASLAGTRLIGPDFGSVCQERQPTGNVEAAERTLDGITRSSALQARRQKAVPLIAGALAAMMLAASFLMLGPSTRLIGRMAVCAAAACPVMLLCARSRQEFAASLGIVSLGLFAGGVLSTHRASSRDGFRPKRDSPLSAFPALVSALAVIVVTGDTLLNHDRFTAGSLLGYSPLEGARYYGLGNESMGILAGSLATLCARLILRAKDPASRLPVPSAGWLGAALWLGAGWILAAPSLGAKAGAVPVVGIGLSAFLLANGAGNGKRAFNHRLLAAALVAAALVGGALALLATGRGSEATHVGQVLQQARRFGPGIVGAAAVRKSAMDAHLVLHSVWMAVLAAAVTGSWLVLRCGGNLRRHLAEPQVTQGAAATIACLLFNDAGVVAAALCGCVVWGNLLLTRSAGD